MTEIKSTVPAGKKGRWAVEKFTVVRDPGIGAMFRTGRCVPPGEYTRLMCGGTLVMSDTPDECRDFWEFRYKAKGNVLINGLGLGVCTQAVLAKPEVQHVTVVEIEQDVIDLVAPHVADPRLVVICADAYTWKPPKGVRFDAVWHDIWIDLTSDNLPHMTKLHRKYGRRCDWQDSWGRAYIKYHGGC